MLEKLNASFDLIIWQTQHNFHALLIILAIFIFTYFLTLLLPGLFILGITPRRIYGLIGIPFAPFLHGNFNHLFFNLIPLIVLSNFLLIYGLDYFLTATILITLLSGILLWCFGKSGIHIGASGLITGFWALLVSNIYYQNSLTAIILGIVCAYYFAGIFLGIFPQQKNVSWEGHLFGLFAGIIVSYGFAYSII